MQSFAGERGSVAVITALLMPVLVGGFGIAFETAGWYQTQRSMQNAADSAAIAAATNATPSYAAEADAVAAADGFTNGQGGVVVTASNTAACPSGGNTCYSVTITKPVPLYLIQVLGFHGDTTLNGGYAEQISATSVAQPGGPTDTYCLIALNGGGSGITANGVPNANLNGCDVFSNADATCHGHDLNAGAGDAHGTSTGCGAAQNSNLPLLADPYAYLSADIPSWNCPDGYPQEPQKKHDPALPASNTPSGSVSWGATQVYCGDVQLSADLNVTTPAGGTVLVIANGQLDTNGHTLQTQSGSGLTVIFTSDSSDYGASGFTHAPTGGGTLDIAAPTTGTWSGVSLYQDPRLTAGVDVSAAGNSPTWNITGLVYLPQANVTFSGAVNKSSNGVSCFTMVTGQVTFNGTGDILDEGQCAQAGLTQPSQVVGSRGGLVG